MKRIDLFSALLLISGGSWMMSCAPRVTLLDRQTILEEEAAGDWPQFEEQLLKKGVRHGVTPFPSTPLNAKKSRLYSTLQGEMTE